eukprot:GHRR01028254.1.p2 GENE.GHRR01028254.1~~GHRR01028254.1.p2  ORF type:complete len:109 (+),score=43.77 GHRR01028254.1:575-901(+)
MSIHRPSKHIRRIPCSCCRLLTRAVMLHTGYAQMCNVMCRWLEIADVRVPGSNGSSKATTAAAATGHAAGHAHPAAATAEGARSDGSIVPDEFELLQVGQRHKRAVAQ